MGLSLKFEFASTYIHILIWTCVPRPSDCWTQEYKQHFVDKLVSSDVAAAYDVDLPEKVQYIVINQCIDQFYSRYAFLIPLYILEQSETE